MFLTKQNSNLKKELINIFLIPIYPLSSPYQNWTVLGHLGDWTKGFTVYEEWIAAK